MGFVLLFATIGFAQSQQNAPVVPNKVSGAEAVLQRGTLTGWVPKTYVMGLMSDATAQVVQTYPWGILQKEFKRDFPDFDLDFQILEREDFLQRLHSSRPDPPYPDMGFVDNGRELDPLMKDNAVVTMWGQSRFRTNGWWVIFRQARNFEAGKAFMLWLSQPSHWSPMPVRTTSIGPADIAKVQAISKEAAQGYAAVNPESLKSIMDPAAGHFNAFGPDGIIALESVEPALTFGNSRLAFVLLAEIGHGEKAVKMAPSFGMTHSMVILKKGGDGWKVLLLLPNRPLPQLENLLRSFDRLGLDEGPPEAVPPVTLLAPENHAQLPRYPRGDLEWGPVDPTLATYVIESEWGNPGGEHWVPSSIELVPPVSSESSLRVKIPFGVGRQPHRWRVWAISKSGVVSMSEGRIIDFTN